MTKVAWTMNRRDATTDTDIRFGFQRESPSVGFEQAGSGKSNTLAHRVAHLIVSGADPRQARTRSVENREPLPCQGHVPLDLLALRQRRDRARRSARRILPVVRWLAAELKELFAAYVEAKQKHNVLDYDDPLLYWAQMMSDAAIADDVGGRFDHVLVDEYQDTNRLQSSVLLALKPAGLGLPVVGDDAQSIYSFRVATVRNILDFPEQFSPKAEIGEEALHQNLWTERASSGKPRLVAVRDEADQAALHRRADPGEP
jgi:superfamily I DNA/RNA helicase